MEFLIVGLALVVVALAVVTVIQKRKNKELEGTLKSVRADLASSRSSVNRLTDELAAERKKSAPKTESKFAGGGLLSKIASPSAPRPAEPKKATPAPKKSASTPRPQSSSGRRYGSGSYSGQSSYGNDGFSNGLMFGALAAGMMDSSSNNDSSSSSSSYSDSSSSSSYSSDSSSSSSSYDSGSSSSSYDSGSSFSGGDSGSF